MSLLVLEDLAINAGTIALVDGVYLEVESGEVVALVGESGCGKSLTALSVMGLLGEGLSIERGRITLAGNDLTHATEEIWRTVRGSDLAMIFQEHVSSLNPLMPVGEQVAESLIVHRRASAREAMTHAIDMLRRVGISEPARRARQLPTELSGGMCQRVMIAAALISTPRILIADEPTTALDVTIQAQILELMGELVADSGTAMLLITHDMGVVAEMADTVCVMYGGRVVEQGPVENIFATPHHPYTRMLLRTLPRLDKTPNEELYAIPGNVPSPQDWPDGCRFQSRCDRASAACSRRPLLKGGIHRTACFHPEGLPS